MAPKDFDEDKSGSPKKGSGRHPVKGRKGGPEKEESAEEQCPEFPPAGQIKSIPIGAPPVPGSSLEEEKKKAQKPQDEEE